jgi:AcrR family transcriptional regulator
MGSNERRAREKESLRRAILDAARELFVEQGFDAVSMRKIAERIEYSPTTLYLYFKDKDEILRALIEEGFVLLCACLEAERIDDPEERLRHGARRYFEFARTQPHYYAIMFEICDDDFEQAIGPKPEIGTRAFGFIRSAVQDGQARGLFRTDIPEPVLAHVIWAHIHGAVALGLAQRLSMLPQEHHPAFFDGVVETTLRGLRP